jgi:hypothetical protein
MDYVNCGEVNNSVVDMLHLFCLTSAARHRFGSQQTIAIVSVPVRLNTLLWEVTRRQNQKAQENRYLTCYIMGSNQTESRYACRMDEFIFHRLPSCTRNPSIASSHLGRGAKNIQGLMRCLSYEQRVNQTPTIVGIQHRQQQTTKPITVSPGKFTLSRLATQRENQHDNTGNESTPIAKMRGLKRTG